MSSVSTRSDERDRAAGRAASRGESGEFELVLGNKQLLSVFFIVVILLGVFFTMGYVVGRNSAPVVVESSQRPDPVGSEHTGGPSALGAKTESNVPATDLASTEVPLNHPEPKASSVPSTPEKPAREASTGISPANNGGVTQPVPGQTYMQVTAVGKPEAEVLVEVLGKHGFRAIVAPGPDEKRFRVLVGPVRDVSEIGKLKDRLSQLGFAGAFPKKY